MPDLSIVVIVLAAAVDHPVRRKVVRVRPGESEAKVYNYSQYFPSIGLL